MQTPVKASYPTHLYPMAQYIGVGSRVAPLDY